MRVLVSPASTHGATAEIGRAIAATLRRFGLDVDVAQPEHLYDLRPYSGFVLGSALYRGGWKDEAQHFIEEHAEVISALPCWLFSSGPVADGQPDTPLDPEEEERLTALTGAREHRVFGGRIDLDRLSEAERSVARWASISDADARSWDEIEAWATHIAAELVSGTQRSSATSDRELTTQANTREPGPAHAGSDPSTTS